MSSLIIPWGEENPHQSESLAIGELSPPPPLCVLHLNQAVFSVCVKRLKGYHPPKVALGYADQQYSLPTHSCGMVQHCQGSAMEPHTLMWVLLEQESTRQSCTDLHCPLPLEMKALESAAKKTSCFVPGSSSLGLPTALHVPTVHLCTVSCRESMELHLGGSKPAANSLMLLPLRSGV